MCQNYINVFVCSTVLCMLVLATRRSLKMDDTVSAVIPVAGDSEKLVALIGRRICLVHRETGTKLVGACSMVILLWWKFEY